MTQKEFFLRLTTHMASERLTRVEIINAVRAFTGDFDVELTAAFIQDFENFYELWTIEESARVFEHRTKIIQEEAKKNFQPIIDKDVFLNVPIITPKELIFVEEYINHMIKAKWGKDKTNAAADEAIATTADQLNTPELPDQLNTPEALAILQRAIDLGLCDSTYHWQKTKRLLAWFAKAVSLKLNLGKGEIKGVQRISWKPFEKLFNVSGLCTIDADMQKVGAKPMDDYLIDEVLK